MGDVEAKARFRIMMLIAELQELADASAADTREHARVEALLLHTIDALGQKPSTSENRLTHISSPGRA